MSLFVKLGVAGIVLSTLSCSADRPLLEDDAATVSVHEAIVHGAIDRGRHPAVVALLSDRFLCTAVVVAPDVVLTARHCVADVLVSRIECPARVRQIGPSYAPASLTVHLEDDARSPIAARGRAIHVPRSDALCEADIALVELDRPLAVTPLRIARPDGARPLNAAGARIDAVGYGKLGDRGGDGIRRFRSSVPVLEASAAELVVGEATCSGDSGGPALDEVTGEIVGILSRGSARCGGTSSRNVYVRLGPHRALLDRVLGTPPAQPPSPSPSEVAHDVGDPCTEGTTCASGICVSPAASGYCSRPCGPAVSIGGRCPRGHRCARRTGSTQGVCARHLPEDADPR